MFSSFGQAEGVRRNGGFGVGAVIDVILAGLPDGSIYLKTARLQDER
jgi:hypothetical protein